MKRRRRDCEEQRTVVAAKVIGALLLPLLLVPLPIVISMRQCNLFPDGWLCGGGYILSSPVARILYVLAAAAYVFGVYHIVKGNPK